MGLDPASLDPSVKVTPADSDETANLVIGKQATRHVVVEHSRRATPYCSCFGNEQ